MPIWDSLLRPGYVSNGIFAFGGPGGTGRNWVVIFRACSKSCESIEGLRRHEQGKQCLKCEFSNKSHNTGADLPIRISSHVPGSHVLSIIQ